MAELHRCVELWYDDGNIVIQAQTSLFRVYAGILSKHSPIFKDLLTLPKPSRLGRYEDCPLIKLDRDKAEDVQDFLFALLEIE